jgi:NTP pyrophosphatase (non-canonical NTP hydrolase)
MDTITIYQTQAARTLIDEPGFELSGQQIMTIWDAIGLAGEAGEVCDLIKKGIFHQHGLDIEKLRKELGDVCWYLAAICTTNNLSLAHIMDDNIAKLKERYPNGYNSMDSVKRVDIKP